MRLLPKVVETWCQEIQTLEGLSSPPILHSQMKDNDQVTQFILVDPTVFHFISNDAYISIQKRTFLKIQNLCLGLTQMRLQSPNITTNSELISSSFPTDSS